MTDVKLRHCSSPEIVKVRIQMASPEMQIREMLQNAIEATLDVGTPIVKFDEELIEGVPKLALWNNGRGMNHDQLVGNMNLAASGDEKTQGVRANFGVGAKVTGLKANQMGLIYRSCVSGVAREIHVGWDDDDEAALLSDGGESPVADISERYHETELESDWTQVIFLGDEVDQDTTREPYFGRASLPGGTPYWLTTDITRRFYDIKAHNVLAICPGAGRSRCQKRSVPGMKHQPVDCETTVEVSPGLSIRYAKVTPDPPGSNNQHATGYSSHVALVYKNEIYDFRRSTHYDRVASEMGIPFGHKEIVVQVLLDDRHALLSSDLYRKGLEIETRGKKVALAVPDFFDEIHENRPQWLKDHIAASIPKARKSSNYLKRTLNKMLDAYKTRRKIARTVGEPDAALKLGEIGSTGPRPDPPEGREIKNRPGKGTGRKRRKRLDRGHLKPSTSTRVKHQQELPSVFWEPLGSDGSGQTYGGRIGWYDEGGHKIILNQDHESLAEIRNNVLADLGLSSGSRHLVDEHVEEQIEVAAVGHVLCCIFSEGYDSWCVNDVNKAISPVSLTVACTVAGRIEAAVKARLKNTAKKKRRGTKSA
jgi:hypothetical protein